MCCGHSSSAPASLLSLSQKGGGSGVVGKSSCTNSRRCVIRLVVMMFPTSVVLPRMQVIDGELHPAERFVKMLLQCGSPWAILLMCFE